MFSPTNFLMKALTWKFFYGDYLLLQLDGE